MINIKEKSAFVIAAPSSGSGKSTVAMGIMAALKRRGLRVRGFKIGPDYIDPSFYEELTGEPAYNLDTWMMGEEGVRTTFTRAMQSCEAGVIEGVMGLFDGRGSEERGSSAHLAKVLELPVILVVDAAKMSSSIAPVIYGFENFDPQLKLAGVVLNRVGSERHARLLRAAIEARCKTPIIGVIHRNEKLELPSRYLGLRQSKLSDLTGVDDTENYAENLVRIIEESIDLERLCNQSELRFDNKLSGDSESSNLTMPPRIAVARDEAFSFYYRENIELLEEAGAEIVYFSPLRGDRLPGNSSGLYLGGGYPELYAERLSGHSELLKDIREFSESGGPIYAECGGLIFLGAAHLDGSENEIALTGVFPWRSRVLPRRRALGYREVEATEAHPFLAPGEKMRGHEFHYSELTDAELLRPGYRVYVDDSEVEPEGYVINNTFASYIHLHFVSNPKFARSFVEAAKKYYNQTKNEEVKR